MLASVQYLRGVAALMVVVYHAFSQLEHMGYTADKPVALSGGVDIFFVVSGFVMVLATARHPDRGGWAFLRDRVVRVVPLYWAVTAFTALLLLLAPGVARTRGIDPAHVVASFLFVPWPHPVQPFWWPLAMQGWTLNYEMGFYLLFATALTLGRGRRGLVVGGCCAVLLLATLVPLAVPVRGGLFGFYTQSLVLEFAFGMLLAEFHLRRAASPSRLWWGVVALGALGIAASSWADPWLPRALAMGVPALLVVLGLLYAPLALSPRVAATARLLGDSSYSLYLSHFLPMSALGQLWGRYVDGGPPGWIAFTLLSTAVCTIGGLVTWYVLERPLTRWAGRLAGR